MTRAETLRAEAARLKDNIRWRGERLRESQGEVDEARARRLTAEDRKRIETLEGDLRALDVEQEGKSDAP